MHIYPLENTGTASSLSHWLIGGIALVAAGGRLLVFQPGRRAQAPPRSTAIPVRVGRSSAATWRWWSTPWAPWCPTPRCRWRARVQGVIESTDFKEGQLVKKGDLLFVIDPRPYQAAYDNAVATLATAKAKADRYKNC